MASTAVGFSAPEAARTVPITVVGTVGGTPARPERNRSAAMSGCEKASIVVDFLRSAWPKSCQEEEEVRGNRRRPALPLLFASDRLKAKATHVPRSRLVPFPEPAVTIPAAEGWDRSANRAERHHSNLRSCRPAGPRTKQIMLIMISRPPRRSPSTNPRPQRLTRRLDHPD
jgi:hypothetical protein